MKKIIFMGTPEFSVPILEALVLDENYEVIAVVTQPDRKVGRKKIVTPPPVKVAALKYNIPIFQPEKLSGSKELEKLISLSADLIITAAYGQFLPNKLLTVPRYGAINVHASLLPKYRGGAPVHYALMSGEDETGVTIMRMVKKMDAGAILSQKSIPIEHNDDVGSMFSKLSSLGRGLLLETLPQLFEDRIKEREQNEEEVTYSPNITSSQEQINWNNEAKTVDFLVRGLRPFPGAYTFLNGKRLKIWDVKVVDEECEGQPGEIIQVDKNTLRVACGGKTCVDILSLQTSGKGRMNVRRFLTGAGKELEVGDYIG
ncbi:methionyl-tRNA formyltransferase [Lacticigenium naphthae]|uniref:methionyl-tRNA formyltransferase n=1 Tax=Lacticigenium naphthae TaxID=515351 RepID=UPI0003F7E3D5|nr:methionyl-tRNA formyltransferase [Lacticigenium naphthae]